MSNFRKRIGIILSLFVALALHASVLIVYAHYEVYWNMLPYIAGSSVLFCHAFIVFGGIAMFMASYLVPAMILTFVMLKANLLIKQY